MYKLIENEESVYKVILKEENSIKSEHTGKVLKEYKFDLNQYLKNIFLTFFTIRQRKIKNYRIKTLVVEI